MKLLLVSNGSLSKGLYMAMEHFYHKPDIDYIILRDSDKKEYIAEIEAYMKKYIEDILVLCDAYGSTAFNEIVVLINKLERTKSVGVICGMNLPMVFKIYGLKDMWSLASIKSFYKNSEKQGVIVYSPKVKKDRKFLFKINVPI
jgi:mannose/fructose-specific phosphotransferase system component IIA